MQSDATSLCLGRYNQAPTVLPSCCAGRNEAQEMPTSIDFPLKQPQRTRRRFFLLFGILAVIVFGGRTAVSYFVDLLWFRSLGYGSVFTKSLALQWSIFAFFAVFTFLILYGAFAALKRAHLPDLPSDHTLFFGGQPIKLPVEPVMRLLALGGSLAIALITAAGMMAEWPMFALFWYAPRTTGSVVDPIFGKPLNFFLFTLPAWQLLSRLVADARDDELRNCDFLSRHHRGSGRFRQAPQLSHPAFSRSLDHVRFSAAHDCGACLSWPVRSFTRRPHHLCGRHLHRRAHHACRVAAGLRGAGIRRCGCCRQCTHRRSGAVVDRGDSSRRSLLRGREPGGLAGM